jgi:hypothetical protein
VDAKFDPLLYHLMMSRVWEEDGLEVGGVSILLRR